MRALRVQFGCRLPQLRRQKDLTQEQRAEAAGRCVDMRSNIERGVHAPLREALETASGVPHPHGPVAVKRGGRWYSTVAAVKRYRKDVEEGGMLRGGRRKNKIAQLTPGEAYDHVPMPAFSSSRTPKEDDREPKTSRHGH